MNKYNFDKNIKELSTTDKLEDISKEWLYIRDEKDEGKCICNKKINHKFYYYNEKTDKFITIGEVCRKKLSLERANRKVNYSEGIKKVVNRLLNKSEPIFEGIIDLMKYSEDNRIRLVECIMDMIEEEYNKDELDEILTQINLLVKNDKIKEDEIFMSKLEEIIKKIEDKLNKIRYKEYIIVENRRLEEEKRRLEEERKQKEKMKEEKLRKERERLYEMERKRYEKEMLEKRREEERIINEEKRRYNNGEMKMRNKKYKEEDIDDILYYIEKNISNWNVTQDICEGIRRLNDIIKDNTFGERFNRIKDIYIEIKNMNDLDKMMNYLKEITIRKIKKTDMEEINRMETRIKEISDGDNNEEMKNKIKKTKDMLDMKRYMIECKMSVMYRGE
jgi:hypothetical protein